MATSAKSSEDLLAAVNGNNLDRLKKILQSGVDPNINRGKMYYLIPLLVAAWNGKVEMVKCLLQFKADVHIENENGQTALHWAARNRRADIVELLISHGADVNKQTTNGGWTALHSACYNGHVACVRILLEHGADVALRTSDGKTARDLAVENKNADVVQLLDDFIWTRVNGLQSMCGSMAGELHDLKEKLRELDSVKAEMTVMKAEMVQLSTLKTEVAQLSASKAEVDQLSTLKAEVDVDQLSTLRAELGQMLTLQTAVGQHSNDIASLVEELFPKEGQAKPTPSIDIQLRSISQSQDVEDNLLDIGKELGYSNRQMMEFIAKYNANGDTVQLAVLKILQTWCENSSFSTDDEKMGEIWRVLGKFGISELKEEE